MAYIFPSFLLLFHLNHPPFPLISFTNRSHNRPSNPITLLPTPFDFPTATLNNPHQSKRYPKPQGSFPPQEALRALPDPRPQWYRLDRPTAQRQPIQVSPSYTSKLDTQHVFPLLTCPTQHHSVQCWFMILGLRLLRIGSMAATVRVFRCLCRFGCQQRDPSGSTLALSLDPPPSTTLSVAPPTQPPSLPFSQSSSFCQQYD